VRSVAWAAVLAGLLSLVIACDMAGGEEPGADGSLEVLASFSVIADFAEEVGGERVDVDSIIPVGADPHDYEPTPSDAAAIADADVVLRNGYALEPGLDPLVAAADTDVVALAEHLDARPDEDGDPDPHLWMVPPKAGEYVDRIAHVLTELDPDGADTYANNADRYRAELDELDRDVAEVLDTVPEADRRLVTSHDAYAYFADHYGWEVLETVVGISTEEEPSAGHVRQIVDTVREEGVPTIFVETTVNPAVIERIARDAGVDVGAPLYGDSVGEPGTDAEDYAGMLRANAAALADGLGGTTP
jgi:manganese/iron transport system substrate-binding protein